MKKTYLYESPKVEIYCMDTTVVLCTSGNDGVNQNFEDDAYEYELN